MFSAVFCEPDHELVSIIVAQQLSGIMMIYTSGGSSPVSPLQSKNHSLPPVSLQGQLLWREFFYTVASATPNFTKMVGNPICLQIDWYQDAERLHKWRTVMCCISIWTEPICLFLLLAISSAVLATVHVTGLWIAFFFKSIHWVQHTFHGVTFMQTVSQNTIGS